MAEPTVDVYSRPSFGSDLRKTFLRDDLLQISGAAMGDAIPAHNRVWYEIEGLGFAHSSSVQPVMDSPNEPLLFVPYAGQLMEVTVPFVEAFHEPSSHADKAYRFYYGSTHWVNGVSRDEKERLWYRIFDDKYTVSYYARAEAFRPILVAELAPISSDIPRWEKRIRVDLERQWMQCFEGDQLAFTSRISSGRMVDHTEYWTPAGNFITFRKRPSRHMVAGNRATGYDLPGVPWVSYITDYGVAFHGTYWHNDFGTPRSHGCINLTPAASRWLYRWTHPIVPAHEMESWVNYGTRVEIHL